MSNTTADTVQKRKSRGKKGELALVHFLQTKGWAAHRSAMSGIGRMTADVEATSFMHLLEVEVKTARTAYVKIRQGQLLKLYDALAFHHGTNPDARGIACCVVMFAKQDWIWYKLQQDDWIKPFLLFRRTDQSNFSIDYPGESNFPETRPPVVTNPRRLKEAVEVAALRERLKVREQEVGAQWDELKELRDQLQELKLQVHDEKWERLMEQAESMPSPVKEDIRRLKEDVQLLADGGYQPLRPFRSK